MTVSCPKCGRQLRPAGEADCDGKTYPVYQCDNSACVVSVEIMGESFPAAYTFCLSAAGVAFNPADGPPERN